MNYKAGVNAYQSINAHTSTLEADPHRLIQLLLEGALSKLRLAKGYMEQNNVHDKGVNISLALSIIEALKCSLDKDKGGEIATNLDNLYEYIMQSLLEANLDNSVAKIDESIRLISTIKEGWDQIKPQQENAK